MYHIKKYGRGLPGKVSTPFPRDYRPELDTTDELDHEETSYYHSAIRILRWIVELGQFDIITEVSMLSSHPALPRVGHLETVFTVFGYLKAKHNSVTLFDPTYPDIDMTSFKQCNWKDFYRDAKKPIPLNTPPPRGKEVDLRLFVDADYANDRVNRRMRSGYIMYINMAPISWQSKK